MVAAVLDGAGSGEFLVLWEGVAAEANLVGDDNTGVAWELEGSTAEGLEGVLEASSSGTDAHDLGAVAGAGDHAFWLTEGVTHTSLKSIGTSGGKHLVDTKNMEWVKVDTDVIAFLAHGLHHVTVGADTSSLKSLRGDALLLKKDKAAADWEKLGLGGTNTSFVSNDTWIWNTTAEAALWIRTVANVAVATSWTAAH